MTIDINIRGDIKALTRDLTKLEKRLVPAATASALNKTATSVRKSIGDVINDETKLKKGYIKRKFTIVAKAHKGNLRVVLATARRTDTNLIEWTTAKNKDRAFTRKRGGVTSKAWGANTKYKGSFIGHGKNSGKLLVFAKDSGKASGVRALHGPNLKAILARQRIVDRMTSIARLRFRKVFVSELRYRLNKSK